MPLTPIRSSIMDKRLTMRIVTEVLDEESGVTTVRDTLELFKMKIEDVLKMELKLNGVVGDRLKEQLEG
jgi:predicted amino acid-binding ACT domain protein